MPRHAQKFSKVYPDRQNPETYYTLKQQQK